jgi:hypothetical protein
VRQSTAASLRRLSDGDFELTTDVAVKLALRGNKLAVLRGGQSAPAPVAAEPGGWLTVELPPSDTPYRVQVSKGK